MNGSGGYSGTMGDFRLVKRLRTVLVRVSYPLATVGVSKVIARDCLAATVHFLHGWIIFRPFDGFLTFRTFAHTR